jgi:MFS transporter, DHA2 family, methylenomycin A resistance protein
MTCTGEKDAEEMVAPMGEEHASTTGTDRRGLILLIMTAGYFLVLLDVTIINVTLPSIRIALGSDVGTLQWFVDGYAVALAALLLTGGTLGDLYGHKRVVLGGFALFGAASLVCGLAPSSGVLIVGRVMQGVGAAVLLPGTLAIINRAYGGDRGAQARAISIWAAVGSLALPAGPLLGGLFVEATSWRGVFLINLPFVAITIAASLWIVSESERPSEQRLDWPGTVLGALLLAALTLAFIEDGYAGWSSAPVIVALIGAVAALAALAGIGRLRPASPRQGHRCRPEKP